MAGDFYVSFGADTSEFEATMAKANADVRGLSRELASLAGEMRKSGAAAESELGQKLNGVAGQLAEAKGHVRDLKKELKGGGEGGFMAQLRELLEGLTHPLMAVRQNLGEIAEIFAAAFAVEKIGEFAESMAKAGFETKRAMEILGASAGDVAKLDVVAKASGISLDELEMAFARMSRNLAQESKETKLALATLGLSLEDLKGRPAVEQLDLIADAFAKLPAGGLRDAAVLELLGRSAINMIPMLAQGSQGIEEIGQMAERAGTQLSDDLLEKMEDTHHGLTEFGAAMEGLGYAIYDKFAGSLNGAIQILDDLVEAIQRSIVEDGVWGAALQNISWLFQQLTQFIGETIQIVRQLDVAGEEMGKHLEILLRFQQLLLHPFGGSTAGIVKEMAAATEQAKKSEEEFKKIGEDAQKEYDKIWGIKDAQEQHTKAIGGSSEAAADLRRRFEEVMGSVKGTGGEIDELTKKIETLKQALGEIPAAGGAPGTSGALPSIGQTGSAPDLVRHFEGYQSKAYWDVNAYRAGYGSDTTTDSSGGVHPVTADTTTTREDAERDLARRTAEFAAKAAEQVGDAWAKLSDRVRASLTSMAYNYGHLPSDVAAAARSGDSSAIAGAIRSHERDNGGVNSGRRAQEAANVEGMDLSPDQRKGAEGALSELQTKKLEAEQKAAGGSASKKAELDIAEKEAAGAQNALDLAKEKLDAANADAAANRRVGGDKEKQLDLDLKAAEAAKKVVEVADRQAEAEQKVAVAKAKQAGDAKAVYDAEMKAANVKMTAAGADPAKQAEAMQAQIAAQTAYDAAVREKVAATSRAEIDAAKESFDATKTQLDEKLKLHQINDAQWLAGTKGALEQEKAAVQEAFDKELAAQQQNSNKRIEIKAQEQKALAEISKQEAQAGAKAAEDTEKQYESSIGGILSSFTSAFKGMISGHETFRQAMLKAMENLGSKFADMVEKMVVKWLAGQLAQTAATTTGVAVRAAAEQTGSAANAGQILESALKSISTSAGQAFAGVFGFSAPLLGPAAAGPAAAAEATVLSVGTGLVSADIGMWSVPNDMVAQIHRNELVMPAAQAGAFRDMLSGGGAGGGNQSVSIHPTMAVKVGAMDAASFRGWARNNQRDLMKAMSTATREGAHLGLKGLRR